MRWTRAFLIVLTLLSLGCARGDWTTQTLTLVDVTGTWEGQFNFFSPHRVERTTRWVLQQKGGKVKGQVLGTAGTPVGSVEGLIKGEAFTWQLIGPFIALPSGNSGSGRYLGEAMVNSDEISGRASGDGCPCTFVLRRVGTQATGEKKAQ